MRPTHCEVATGSPARPRWPAALRSLPSGHAEESRTTRGYRSRKTAREPPLRTAALSAFRRRGECYVHSRRGWGGARRSQEARGAGRARRPAGPRRQPPADTRGRAGSATQRPPRRRPVPAPGQRAQAAAREGLSLRPPGGKVRGCFGATPGTAARVDGGDSAVLSGRQVPLLGQRGAGGPVCPALWWGCGAAALLPQPLKYTPAKSIVSDSHARGYLPRRERDHWTSPDAGGGGVETGAQVLIFHLPLQYPVWACQVLCFFRWKWLVYFSFVCCLSQFIAHEKQQCKAFWGKTQQSGRLGQPGKQAGLCRSPQSWAALADGITRLVRAFGKTGRKMAKVLRGIY